jgi:hypothetical protein
MTHRKEEGPTSDTHQRRDAAHSLARTPALHLGQAGVHDFADHMEQEFVDFLDARSV